jgi:hypothetical protein
MEIMKPLREFIDELYENVAKYHNTTVAEVIRRSTLLGESLVHQYYIGTYGEDFS